MLLNSAISEKKNTLPVVQFQSRSCQSSTAKRNSRFEPGGGAFSIFFGLKKRRANFRKKLNRRVSYTHALFAGLDDVTLWTKVMDKHYLFFLDKIKNRSKDPIKLYYNEWDEL